MTHRRQTLKIRKDATVLILPALDQKLSTVRQKYDQFALCLHVLSILVGRLPKFDKLQSLKR